MNHPEDFAAAVRKLTEVLTLSERMRGLDTKEEPGASRLAYSLVEIEKSARRISKELVPKLAISSDAASIEATLHEIGEELRHVFYHVGDSGYFDYLVTQR